MASLLLREGRTGNNVSRLSYDMPASPYISGIAEQAQHIRALQERLSELEEALKRERHRADLCQQQLEQCFAAAAAQAATASASAAAAAAATVLTSLQSQQPPPSSTSTSPCHIVAAETAVQRPWGANSLGPAEKCMEWRISTSSPDCGPLSSSSPPAAPPAVMQHAAVMATATDALAAAAACTASSDGTLGGAPALHHQKHYGSEFGPGAMEQQQQQLAATGTGLLVNHTMSFLQHPAPNPPSAPSSTGLLSTAELGAGREPHQHCRHTHHHLHPEEHRQRHHHHHRYYHHQQHQHSHPHHHQKHIFAPSSLSCGFAGGGDGAVVSEVISSATGAGGLTAIPFAATAEAVEQPVQDSDGACVDASFTPAGLCQLMHARHHPQPHDGNPHYSFDTTQQQEQFGGCASGGVAGGTNSGLRDEPALVEAVPAGRDARDAVRPARLSTSACSCTAP
ncbi:hypothetical protein Vretifemale_12227, partial [Volvox reticuliferus]